MRKGKQQGQPLATAWRKLLRAPPVRTDEELKLRYFDFFVALADEMTTPEARSVFYQRYAERFATGGDGNGDGDGDGNGDGGGAAEGVLERVRSFLESKVPDDFARGSRDRRRGTGSYRKTKARVGRILFPHSKL